MTLRRVKCPHSWKKRSGSISSKNSAVKLTSFITTGKRAPETYMLPSCCLDVSHLWCRNGVAVLAPCWEAECVRSGTALCSHSYMAPGLEQAQSTQKGILSAPTYLYFFIHTGIFSGCKQAVLNMSQRSAGDPILVGWKNKLELRIPHGILEMHITGHMRCSPTVMAKIQPHGMKFTLESANSKSCKKCKNTAEVWHGPYCTCWSPEALSFLC